ncbi:MAG TPA: PAS domain S-box protein [Chryseosolibacter sp.]
MNTADSSVCPSDAQFLSGGGEMGFLTRTFNWSAHPLGPVEAWPQSLKTTLGLILHSSFPMLLLWGNDLTCFYNEAFRPSLVRTGKHPALGKNARDIWRETWSFIGPLMDKVLHEGESVFFEDRLMPSNQNGRVEHIYWTFSYSPAYDDEGRVNGVFITCTETTHNVNLIKSLEHSNQRFQALVSQTAISTIVLVGEELVVDIVNDAYARLIGRNTDELIGKRLFDVVPEAASLFHDVVAKVRTTGVSAQLYEQPFLFNGGGRTITGFLDIVCQPYVSGNVTGVIALCQDVTEKVLARKKIQESEERFEAAVQAVEGVVWTNSVDGRMLGEQPGWSALTGQTFDEYHDYGWASVVHPEDAEASIAAWNEAVRESKIFVFRHRLRVKSGEYRLFSIRAIPLKNDDGSIREWVGVHTDITEHNRAEQILKESEERFRSLADNSPMIVYIVEPNPEATMSYFNKTWLDYTGQTFEQAIGRAWDGIVHPDDLNAVFTIYMPAFRQRIAYTLPAIRLRRHDGQYRWHLFKGNPRYLANGDFIGYVGVGIDIHEQKVVQEALLESESRFRNLADRAPMFIWMVDENAVITYANRELLDFIGVPSDTEVAKAGGWEKVTHPDDLPLVYKAFMEGFSSRKEYRVEARLRDKSSGGYQWFLFKAAPKIQDGGVFTGFIGTAVNIHQQKTLMAELEARVQLRTKELNIANQALLQSNDDLKQFAHVASHDLKEPVRKIQTFSHRLHDEFADALVPKAKIYLQKIMRSTDRMSSMIDGVLTYSSLNATEARIEKVDLNAVIENIIVDLEVVIARTHAHITRSQLPVIEGSEVLLYQLFYNLINNSLKFSRKGTHPVIRIEARPSVNRDEVILVVTDNGIGFEKQYADRIFESFTRLNTKDEYEGTGLGLSLCKKIVHRHGGAIQAESTPGEGSSFILHLPVHQAAAKV